ncbi:hypothetical protein GW17_00000420 [Ensete ventricosum]|nr:hypothetical protein GW17_00000420 [Ensete ventricosum]RZR83058.1 hypothetical protein BHM03_00009595 [Ensete ventricosum]
MTQVRSTRHSCSKRNVHHAARTTDDVEAYGDMNRRLLLAPSSGTRFPYPSRFAGVPTRWEDFKCAAPKLALVNGILCVRLHLLLTRFRISLRLYRVREGGSEERVQGGKAAPSTLSRIRALVGGIEASNGGESTDFPGERQVHVPVFSNQDASEDVLHTRRSQLDVKNRVLKVSAKNSEAYAHDGQEPVKVSLNIEASKPSEVPSFQEMKPGRKKDGIRQVGTSPVRNQDAAHRHENETKLTEKDVNTSSQEKGFSSDGTTRKTRKKRRKQGYGNPARDVIVPPFADWEINPESAEKYTDVFKIIGDSRKFPGTPIKLPIESDTHKKDPNECKVGRLPQGCRCLSWIFKCKSCW